MVIPSQKDFVVFAAKSAGRRVRLCTGSAQEERRLQYKGPRTQKDTGNERNEISFGFSNHCNICN